MRNRTSIHLLLIVSLALLMACSSGKRVTRIKSDTVTDLSGRWNDTDSRMVAEEMIKDVLSRPWLEEAVIKLGHKPVVIVGTVRNKSSEHISTEIFTKDMERELINSGKVRFVASSKEREELRLERIDQQTFSSAESMKKLANETGADFMLRGTINSVVDQIEGRRAVFYQVNLELIELESNEKVWIGEKQIKKIVDQDKYGW